MKFQNSLCAKNESHFPPSTHLSTYCFSGVSVNQTYALLLSFWLEDFQSLGGSLTGNPSKTYVGLVLPVQIKPSDVFKFRLSETGKL